jgi:TolB-like protein/Tfp pilus assembly protein PilF
VVGNPARSAAEAAAKVPGELRAVIERCLAKDPASRYQDGAEVRQALEAIEPGTVARSTDAPIARRPLIVAAISIAALALAVSLGVRGVRARFFGVAGANVIKLAVLPFENLTGDPGQECFSDGLTEDMISQLGRRHPQRLSVIARTSSMRYKNSDKTIDLIGRELGVDYVLEGSARREGGHVRINATLIQVRDQTQRWAESYERERKASVLKVQGDVARGVALRARFAPGREDPSRQRAKVNADAHEEYLKGRSHAQQLTRADLETALRASNALEKDPDYALAYTGVAHVWGGRRQMGFVSPRDATPRAEAAILKALALDETLAEAHAALAGHRAYGQYDWAGADVEYRRALELDPNLADAMTGYSHVLHSLGRVDQAMAHVRKALELDPFNANYQAFYGVDLVFARQYDEAIAQFRNALRTSPNLPFAQTQLSNSLHRKGMYDESLAVLKTQALGSGDREFEELLTRGFAEGGYVEAMRRGADAMAARASSQMPPECGSHRCNACRKQEPGAGMARQSV